MAGARVPGIEQRAKAEAGEIHWGDETALVNTDVRGRSYAPRGKTPVTLAVGDTRQKLSMISTVANRGRANWMIVGGAFSHERLIEFLQALVREGKRRRKKVFLILSNLGVSELNPNERLNADLKHAIGTKVAVRTKAKLHTAASEHMQFIQANPQRVRADFQGPIVKYAK